MIRESVLKSANTYASVHGVAAASRIYSKKLDLNVSQSTVRLIMEAYIKELKKQRAAGGC